MLARLDGQLERSDYSVSSSVPLPPQLTGEPMRLPSGATGPLPPLQFAPPPPTAPPRVPLSTVVSSLVDSWSLAFLDLAQSGDGPAMLLVAQMFLVEKGYGAIRYDRAEGVRWLLRCVEADEGESREMCRRLCPVEYAQWLDERRRRAGGDEQLKREHEMAVERQRADCAPSERAHMANKAAAAALI